MIYLIIYLLTADGPAVEGLELEVQLGPRAAKKLLKEMNIVDARTPKFKTVLQKLKEILEGGQRNNNSRFFNHNVLFSPRSSSWSISSSSSVRSSNSHLSKVSFHYNISGFSIYYYSHTLHDFQSC